MDEGSGGYEEGSEGKDSHEGKCSEANSEGKIDTEGCDDEAGIHIGQRT